MSLPQLGYSYPPATTALSSSQLLLSNPPVTTTAGSCCENGRALVTDPRTGQSVCSCQYSPPTGILAYSRLPSLGEPVYPPSPYSPSQSYMTLGADPSAFYSPLNPHYDLKEAGEAWRGIQSPACYPYDPNVAAYPYSNAYGSMDINSAARRKNATRENTNTLKAWLYEHRKNPYPTKGEKIMLAIITKMTLTQVSTWFANARRRLKKENKMTWSPRNRSGDADDDDNKSKNDSDDENDDDKDKDGEKKEEEEDRKPNIGENGISPAEGSGLGGLRLPEEGERFSASLSASGGGDSTCHSVATPPEAGFPGAPVASSPPDQKRPDSLCSNSNDSGLSDVNCNFSEVGGALDPGAEGARPKIWSLARTATSDSPNFLPAAVRGYPGQAPLQGPLVGGMQGGPTMRSWGEGTPSSGGLYPPSMSVPYGLGGQKLPTDSQSLFGSGGSPGMDGGMGPGGSGMGVGGLQAELTGGMGPGPMHSGLGSGLACSNLGGYGPLTGGLQGGYAKMS